MVSTQENAVLRDFAITILTDIAAFSAVSFFHGIFTLLFFFSTAIFLRRGLKTRASWAMFAITLLTYSLSWIYWASDLAVMSYLLKIALIDESTSSLELAQRIKVARRAAITANKISFCASVFPPFISDGVVIWRAWVLFPGQRWIMILPITMFLGTTATSLVFAASRVAGIFPGKINSRLFGATIILSMATNVVTTLIITYKLWSHRKFVIKNLGGNGRRSPAQRVLDLLVESGFVYAAFQIVTLTLDSLPDAIVPGTSTGYAVQVFLTSYVVISAMYPTIIIVLVNTQRSFADTYNTSELSSSVFRHARMDEDSQYRPATKGHLSFAAAPGITSQTDTTALSEETFNPVDGKGGNGMWKDGRDSEKRQVVTAAF